MKLSKRNAGNIRRYSLLFAIPAFLTSAVLIATARPLQVARSSAQGFAGTWKAVHDGKVIVVLRLHMDKDHLSGAIQLAGFQLDLDGDGAVLAVTDDRLDAPIKLKDVNLNGKTLFFDFVDNDGDNDKFQMELTEGNSARLQWIGLPNGMKAQPIAMTRALTRESNPSPKTPK